MLCNVRWRKNGNDKNTQYERIKPGRGLFAEKAAGAIGGGELAFLLAVELRRDPNMFLAPHLRISDRKILRRYCWSISEHSSWKAVGRLLKREDLLAVEVPPANCGTTSLNWKMSVKLRCSVPSTIYILQIARVPWLFKGHVKVSLNLRYRLEIIWLLEALHI